MSKIYITEETVRQARSESDLPAFEDRMVNLIRYRLRMMDISATADAYRKEIKTLVKASDLIFGPGSGKRLKTLAKGQSPYFTQDGGQAGTLHSVSAKLKPHGWKAGVSSASTSPAEGRRAGTSPSATAKHSSDGAEAGTSPIDPAKRPFTDGGQAGTPATRNAQTLGKAWRSGRSDGAGAGTPLHKASIKFSTAHYHIPMEGEQALSEVPPTSPPMEPGQGTRPHRDPSAGQMDRQQAPSLDINWTPFDDFAVGGSYGSYDEDKQQGRRLAKLIARKQGR